MIYTDSKAQAEIRSLLPKKLANGIGCQGQYIVYRVTDPIGSSTQEIRNLKVTKDKNGNWLARDAYNKAKKLREELGKEIWGDLWSQVKSGALKGLPYRLEPHETSDAKIQGEKVVEYYHLNAYIPDPSKPSGRRLIRRSYGKRRSYHDVYMECMGILIEGWKDKLPLLFKMGRANRERITHIANELGIKVCW